jgi:branched-chain amino acid transport system substrate-binding protein
VPSGVAAAGGLVWTIDIRGQRLLRIDPRCPHAVRSVSLPRAPATGLPAGFTPWRLALSADAVWVTNGSRRLIRVDVRSDRVSRIDVGRPLTGVAVAAGSVWVISGPGARVLRIDPAVNRVTGTVSIVGRPGASSPAPVAVEAGNGAIWVLNANTADVSRIDPQQLRVVDTVTIGVEHAPTNFAVGSGAVWVADGDGTLARIDTASQTVHFSVVAHELNDVAVAGGRVWVSAAAGNYGSSPPADARTVSTSPRPSVVALPPASCSPLYYRPGERPRLLIVGDFAFQTTDFGIQDNNAIRVALHDRGFRAGRYAVAYQACDDSTANSSGIDAAKCRANAHSYARDASVIAVIGDTLSGCVGDELPILNRAVPGPLAMISSSTSYAGLTRAGPGALPGEPARYAPTGTRSYVRLSAPDNVQAAADAQVARRLGIRRAYALDNGSVYGAGVAAAFRFAAARLGISVIGHARWGRADDRVAARVRRARADGVFLGGGPPDGAVMITALRRALGPSVQLLAPDGFNSPYTARFAGSAAEGLILSTSGQPVQRLPPIGQSFAARMRSMIGNGGTGRDTIVAAQATQVVLDAISRSDGTRRSVTRALFATRIDHGLLGSFAFTPQGDTTARDVTMYRIIGGAIQFWKVIRPPTYLTGG